MGTKLQTLHAPLPKSARLALAKDKHAIMKTCLSRNLISCMHFYSACTFCGAWNFFSVQPPHERPCWPSLGANTCQIARLEVYSEHTQQAKHASGYLGGS